LSEGLFGDQSLDELELRGDVQPAVRQAAHASQVAGAVSVLPADQCLVRHGHVVEEDLGGPRAGLAHLVVFRSDAEAGGVLGD
jgi:hypothetical protein